MSTGLSLLPLHFTLRTLTHAIHPLSFVFIYELFRQTLHITKCLPHSAHPPEYTRAKSFAWQKPDMRTRGRELTTRGQRVFISFSDSDVYGS